MDGRQTFPRIFPCCAGGHVQNRTPTLPHLHIYSINERSRVKSKLNLRLYLPHFRTLPGGEYCVKCGSIVLQ